VGNRLYVIRAGAESGSGIERLRSDRGADNDTPKQVGRDEVGMSEHQFTLTDAERERLEALALTEPDNIRQIADGLKGEAREKYLIALAERKRR